MSDKLSKTLLNKLKRRGITLADHVPKQKTVTEEIDCSHFTKEDLEDFGSYRIEYESKYGDDYVVLYHDYKRNETQKELAERLCFEFDSAKQFEKAKEKQNEEIIKKAKKMGMVFKK